MTKDTQPKKQKHTYSIISCYHDPKKYERLCQSLEQTTENYQLIGIDNTRNDYSLTAAYNKGASLATGNILCFIHEDVTILTPQWNIAIAEFLDMHPEAGFIGVAGGRMASDTPCNWTSYQPQTHLIHCGKMHGSLKGKESEVVLLDGVFLCCKASLLQEISFDEKLKGFHGYDYDICLQAVQTGFKNYVTDRVLLTHNSRGNRNRPYAEARLHVFRKHRNLLPLFASDIPAEKREEILHRVSYKQMKRTVRLLLRNNYTMEEVANFMQEWKKYAKGLMKASPKLYLTLQKLIVAFIKKT